MSASSLAPHAAKMLFTGEKKEEWITSGKLLIKTYTSSKYAHDIMNGLLVAPLDPSAFATPGQVSVWKERLQRFEAATREGLSAIRHGVSQTVWITMTSKQKTTDLKEAWDYLEDTYTKGNNACNNDEVVGHCMTQLTKLKMDPSVGIDQFLQTFENLAQHAGYTEIQGLTALKVSVGDIPAFQAVANFNKLCPLETRATTYYAYRARLVEADKDRVRGPSAKKGSSVSFDDASASVLGKRSLAEDLSYEEPPSATLARIQTQLNQFLGGERTGAPPFSRFSPYQSATGGRGIGRGLMIDPRSAYGRTGSGGRPHAIAPTANSSNAVAVCFNCHKPGHSYMMCTDNCPCGYCNTPGCSWKHCGKRLEDQRRMPFRGGPASGAGGRGHGGRAGVFVGGRMRSLIHENPYLLTYVPEQSDETYLLTYENPNVDYEQEQMYIDAAAYRQMQYDHASAASGAAAEAPDSFNL